MKENIINNRPAAESIYLAVLLTISGGFLDAYTFCCRDQVFSNAQTGNVVRVGIALARRNYEQVIRFLIPIFAFSCGVFLAMTIRSKLEKNGGSKWQQGVLVMEIIVAVIVSFIPIKTIMNILSNILVSFLCALQAETFRKVNGKVFASTMCTGNLRSGTEFLYQALTQKDPEKRKTAVQYFGIILSFVTGAFIGVHVSNFIGEKAILATVIPYIVAICILRTDYI